MKIVMHDGEQMEYRPGVFAIVPPGTTPGSGHDPCVVIDWQDFAHHAKR